MNHDNDSMDDEESETAGGLSESSLLEQLETDLLHRESRGPTTSLNPIAETLIRLNRTFALPSGAVGPRALGRFQVLRELGRGQFGIVFLAWDPQLKREVAIKLAGQRILDDEGLRRRFQREAQFAGRLDHPGLIRVHEVGESDGHPYFVMAVADGVDLRTWLSQHTSPMPLRDAAAIVADIAVAIQHGHDKGIIHRDLKPANIMIRPADEDSGKSWTVDIHGATLAG